MQGVGRPQDTRPRTPDGLWEFFWESLEVVGTAGLESGVQGIPGVPLG